MNENRDKNNTIERDSCALLQFVITEPVAEYHQVVEE